MFIALNWKALEAALPNMTAASVMLVVAAHVTCQQPLHEVTQCGRVFGFYNEMKVIRHQTKGKELNPMSFLRFNQERKKSFVVLWFVEYRDAAIATVDNVVCVSGLLSSWYTRHRALLAHGLTAFQLKSSLSPLFPLEEFSARSASNTRAVYLS